MASFISVAILYIFMFSVAFGPFIYGAAALISMGFMIHQLRHKKNAKASIVSLIIFGTLSALTGMVLIMINCGMISFM